MVILVRAVKAEAGASIFVFTVTIDNTVLGGCWIVSSAVLVGLTGNVIFEVSLVFFLPFAAASLFLIYFLLRKSFRCNFF